MSARPAPPSLSTSLVAHARMQLLIARRGRLLWLSAALCVLPVAMTVLLLSWDKGQPLFDKIVGLQLKLLWPFAAALPMAPLLGEELERRTYTYFYTRPAPRWALLAGRALALIPLLVAGFVTATLLSYAIAMLRGTVDDAGASALHLARVLVAAVLAIPCYAALSALLGAWFPRQPLLAFGSWVIVVELGLSTSPGLPALLSMSYHLHRLAELAQTPDGGVAIELPALASALVLLLATGLFAVGAAAFARNAEPRAED